MLGVPQKGPGFAIPALSISATSRIQEQGSRFNKVAEKFEIWAETDEKQMPTQTAPRQLRI